jgi:hypothetical protein
MVEPSTSRGCLWSLLRRPCWASSNVVAEPRFDETVSDAAHATMEGCARYPCGLGDFSEMVQRHQEATNTAQFGRQSGQGTLDVPWEQQALFRGTRAAA